MLRFVNVLGILIYVFCAWGVTAETSKTQDVAGKKAEQTRNTGEEGSINKLTERVEMYWTRKIGEKLDKCYEMLTEKSRKETSMVRFIRMSNMRFKKYEIGEINLDPKQRNFARVIGHFNGSAMGYDLEKVRIGQSWYFENGDWFLEFQKTNPFAAGEKTKETSDGSGEKRQINPELLKKFRELNAKMRKGYQPGQSPTERIELANTKDSQDQSTPGTQGEKKKPAKDAKTTGKTVPESESSVKSTKDAGQTKKSLQKKKNYPERYVHNKKMKDKKTSKDEGKNSEDKKDSDKK